MDIIRARRGVSRRGWRQYFGPSTTSYGSSITTLVRSGHWRTSATRPANNYTERGAIKLKAGHRHHQRGRGDAFGINGRGGIRGFPVDGHEISAVRAKS